MGLLHYAEAHAGHFPSLPTRGNEAAGGLYAPILREGGYVSSDDPFFCPATDLADNSAARRSLPTRAQVRTATGENLRALRKKLGGSYGYNLGYVEQGRYQGIRNRSRSTFALVADAPSPTLVTAQSVNHGSRGQNVLFEDGHVDHLTSCLACPYTKDDLYHNDEGQVAAGRHANDTVIGPSDVPPLGWESVE
jgi:hypothetical protein